MGTAARQSQERRRVSSFRALGFLLRLASGLVAAVAPAAANPVPLGSSGEPRGQPVQAPCSFPVALPGENHRYLAPSSPAAWLQAGAVEYRVLWPAGAPADCQTLLFLVDRDGRWYQSLQEARLVPGATNVFVVPLAPAPAATNWQPVGHAGAWHHRARLHPDAVGLRVFGPTPWRGTCVLLSAALRPPAAPPAPPAIARVRPNAAAVPCFGLFEAACDLPDRYDDPFDPDEVSLSATFTGPDGRSLTVDGFRYQEHYRLRDEMPSPPEPQGRPDWRVRFCPRLPGPWRYTLDVKDRFGTASWTNGAFTALPAAGPRFVRVSARDPRYFELDDGAPFVPVGHNIRSPDDRRMDDKFPWRFRQPQGAAAYERYFRSMRQARENTVEIWSCAWSLGIEWSAAIPGYHGAGDYHLGHAWELDRVLAQARQNGLRVNLVLNNHGRVSQWLDAEWSDNPYNRAAGGWLDDSMEFFTDARAAAMQRRLYRYYVARWGWDATILAWQLFSEANLVGSDTSQRMTFDPRVVAWHRQFGAWFHAHDPYAHMVSTHTSADYSYENPELCRLREIDTLAVNAYHYGPPYQIVPLIENTARFHAAFDKPVLITEFGGSPMAAGLEHLKRELHAALWASAATPVSGTPLFWWWQLVEEQGLYPEYAAIARFLEGQDPRNPAMQPAEPAVRLPGGRDPGLSERVLCVAMASPTNGVGWLYLRQAFGQRLPSDGTDDGSGRVLSRLQVVFDNVRPGVYRVDFVDTGTGAPCRRTDVRTEEDRLVLPVPGFVRDIAFRFAPAPPSK
jgi:hypothetical protein